MLIPKDQDLPAHPCPQSSAQECQLPLCWPEPEWMAVAEILHEVRAAFRAWQEEQQGQKGCTNGTNS